MPQSSLLPHFPIRIGYCIDRFDVGGTELNAIRTLEALDLSAFSVTVFHFQADGPLRSRYDALGLRMVHLPIRNLYGSGTARQGFRLGSLVRENGIQILHAHDIYSNIFATPWGRVFGRCRTIASRRWLRETPRDGLASVNRWSYRLATRVLANSTAVAKVLMEEDHVPRRKIFELPNFIDDVAFQRVESEVRAAQRKQWGIPDGAFLVGTVARLASVKNHRLLLQAARRLDEKVHVLFIGDGPERESLQALAKELGLGSRAHFAGQVIAPHNLHQFLDVSVLCSRSEGFPNSLIEALAAERPVIATPVGGVTDIISDGTTGFLVPVNNVDSLAERLKHLQSLPGVGQRVARSGRDQVRARYHISVVLEKLSSFYKDLACATAADG